MQVKQTILANDKNEKLRNKDLTRHCTNVMSIYTNTELCLFPSNVKFVITDQAITAKMSWYSAVLKKNKQCLCSLSIKKRHFFRF